MEWKELHKKVINDFLLEINKYTENYVLKGGTALMMCYNLDRFSEDIDFDSKDHNTIKKFINNYSLKNGYSYRIAKNTDTVQRFMLDYGNNQKPLKIEISFRNKNISENNYHLVNGIKVYNIETISLMKSIAYNGRDKIRDLYDITFICNNYWNELSDTIKDVIRNNLEYKGIEQFDYLINTQKDELIDNNKLAADFLEMYDKLELLIDKDYLKDSSLEIQNIFTKKSKRR